MPLLGSAPRESSLLKSFSEALVKAFVCGLRWVSWAFSNRHLCCGHRIRTCLYYSTFSKCRAANQESLAMSPFLFYKFYGIISDLDIQFFHWFIDYLRIQSFILAYLYSSIGEYVLCEKRYTESSNNWITWSDRLSMPGMPFKKGSINSYRVTGKEEEWMVNPFPRSAYLFCAFTPVFDKSVFLHIVMYF